MTFLQQYPLRISTLSPVHIGCAEDYVPTNYVIEENALYAFDTASIAEALSQQARQQLLTLVSGRPTKDTLQQIQGFFYQNRDALMPAANHFLPVAGGITELYRARIGRTAQHESTGRKVINRLEIERTFYNPTNQQPVIPGSSLKGAIRTALLDSVNQGRPLQHVEDPKTHKSRKENDQELQQRLFEYQMGKLERDPMRLVHLSDATWSGQENIHCSEIRFAVDRPKRRQEKGQQKRTMADEKGLYQLLETIPGMRFRTFVSQLVLHSPGEIPQQNKLPERTLRWSMDAIIKACNAFYRPLLEKELNLLQQNSYVHPDWHRMLQNFLHGELGQALDTGKAFLLRVGRHSGAEAVTLNGVRNIKIMLGKDKGQDWKSEARTVWLAADYQASRSEMQPFGWLLIEVEPQESAFSEMSTLMYSCNKTAQSWTKDQQAKLENLRQAQREQLAKEAQLAEERLKQQQLEAERQQRLEAMTEEEREIEQLREQLEKDRISGIKEPGGLLSNQTSELIRKALGWQPQYRHQVADLAETIYTYLGWGSGKRKKERKDKINSLRSQ